MMKMMKPALITALLVNTALARNIIVSNQCSFTVWPAMVREKNALKRDNLIMKSPSSLIPAPDPFPTTPLVGRPLPTPQSASPSRTTGDQVVYGVVVTAISQLALQVLTRVLTVAATVVLFVIQVRHAFFLDSTPFQNSSITK